MSKIRVNCPSCGLVWLGAWRVILTVSPGGASYRFVCPCGTRATVGCGQQIAALLEDVAVVDRIVPEKHEGPPINYDDVLDAVIALRGQGWERELFATG